ncbi:CbaC protein [Natribaculum luteum]|uniref:CbaC protein n=1 Tax=Natribaculum luteum TaxID=1586232 RepID=A0ABD5NYT5_9EURY|nr:CbaC protein [Natribaculum luteum]
MRISRSGLLILIGILIPVIVELRTLFDMLGIEISVAGTLLIGVLAIGVIVFWATLPESDDSDAA